LAENSGWIESIEPGTIDNVALRVGAGRLAQNSLIDYPAEIVLYHRVGDNFEAVDPLAALHYTNGVLK
jgi:thymidine phosphorylase